MTDSKHLTYRGAVKALTAFQGRLAFVTVHDESLPTGVCLLDAEKWKLDVVALPTGGQCLTTADDVLLVGGQDGKLYQIAAAMDAAKALNTALPAPATALAPLSNGRVAAVCGSTIVIVSPKKKQPLQTLELEEQHGTAIAVSPDGNWLAVGGSKGLVTVFQCEDQDDYVLSASGKIHDGAVTALLFEPEELRFFSAGADQRLLLTHARGELQPEDRGRGNSHSDHVTGMLLAPGERFITTSVDGSCKTWARTGATRPATLTDGVPTVTAAAMLPVHQRDHLVIVGKDNAMRFIVIDAGGRFGALNVKVYDAYDRAKHMLQQDSVATRGDALHALAEYDDKRAIGMLADSALQDSDRPLRLKAAELLAASTHAHSRSLLEPLLQHQDAEVRQLAFDGLYQDKDELRPLKLALKAGHANVGVAAIQALRKLAKQNDLAHQMLVGAMDHDPRPVRLAAMLALESVFPKNSVEPTLLAMRSQHIETQRLAMLRAHQRGLLEDSRIIAALRRATEDEESDDARRTAVLISILSKPALAKAVRERDPEMHRQLFELENEKVEVVDDTEEKAKSRKPPKLKPTKLKLDTSDYQPLLSAMASRVADTSLAGARGLAVLGDARAFGALLQLSREPSEAARVEVCRSFGSLGDARAAQRLASLVNDKAASVRDAAYTALTAVYEEDPLAATAAGLASSHQDVRRRGLQTLVATLKKKKAKSVRERGEALMLIALNDDAADVRGEAFKSTLSLGLGDAGALKFALQSVHASVRNEVLTEAMANHKQPWAQELLSELLSDPDAQVRQDAYQQLLKPSRGRDIAPMRAGLQSRYSDVRHAATLSLIGLQTHEAQQELIQAIDDENAEVRGTALKAMMTANAVDVLHQAMESRHADVRIDAAAARALFRDEKARQPLLAIALSVAPENDAERKLWQQRAVKAVHGLGLMGDPELIASLTPLLDHEDQELRREAATAIVHCAEATQRELLLPHLSHSDNVVRCQLALALALCREQLALPIVFSTQGEKSLTEPQRLMGAIAFGDSTETQLAAFLDSDLDWIRDAALQTLLFRDWLQSDGTPRRILLAFAAQAPRARLIAARALEAYLDGDHFASHLLEQINERHEPSDWSLSAETLRELAEALVFGSPQLQAHTAMELRELFSSEQARWEFRWMVHCHRWTKAIQDAKHAATAGATAIETTDVDELRALAFGAYVGLVREQGATSSGAVAVRQAAIRRLVEMAQEQPELLDAVRPVIVQTLSDENQQVRMLAFAKLEDLDLPADARAEAAIESGRDDLATEGLTLLSSVGGKEGQAILEKVITSRPDGLALTAATLLRKLAGSLATASAGLDSPNATTRIATVRWLAEDYDTEPKAKSALADACKNRDLHVRIEAALALTRKKDPASFPVLLAELQNLTLNARLRKQLLRGIVQLGDPRGSEALLDFLQRDSPSEPAAILGAVGALHHPNVVPRLLGLLEKRELCQAASMAILEISGHLQPIYDVEEENDLGGPPNWQQQQRPRHDQVLADYLQRCLDLGLATQLADPRVLSAARWSQSEAVMDEPLAAMAFHADASVRLPAVEAIGWRLRKRNGPADKLVELLEHRDTATKFSAAVGLAKDKRADGLSILLSAVELMSDLGMRVQAVEALGELGNQNDAVVELLLKLASDDQHALQTASAEAIGHLGDSDHADEIFALLERLARGPDTLTAGRAAVGLRWFATPAGWALLRQIADEDGPVAESAVGQLGYNDDPATRALLLKRLRSGNIFFETPNAARRVFGMDSIEPDLAILASGSYYSDLDSVWDSDGRNCWERVCNGASAEQILDIFESADNETQSVLGGHLLQLQPLPLESAAKRLAATTPAAVGLAAQIVGRGEDKEHGKPLKAALEHWLDEWNGCRRRLLKGDWEAEFDLPARGEALRRIVWAMGRVGGDKASLLALVDNRPNDATFDEIRCAALDALASRKLTVKESASIANALRHPSADVRQRAAELLASVPQQAETLATAAVSDWMVYQRLPATLADPDLIKTSAASPHLQGIVLPTLVADKEVDGLAELASSTQLEEAARLGAIEALAWMADEEAEARLVEVGKNEDYDDELRKAAWRGLRRSKRQRDRNREGEANQHG